MTTTNDGDPPDCWSRQVLLKGSDSETAMDDVLVFMLGGLAFVFAILLCLRQTSLLYYSCASRGDAFRSVTSPENESVSPVAKHVEATTRVAAEGFVVCHACDFTNPRRATACVVCGWNLEARPTRLMFGLHSNSKPHATRLAKRQRRARRRREWVREVKCHGDIKWKNTTLTEMKAYVINSVRNDDSDLIEIAIDSPSLLESMQTSARTLSSAAGFIEQEFQQYVTRIVQVKDADAVNIAYARFTHQHTLSPYHSMLEDAVGRAKFDFPSKFAHFVNITAEMLRSTGSNASTSTTACISVLRSELLTDSMSALATMTSTQARAPMRVDFIGEQGIDAGGIYREWSLLINRAIITPEAGVFVCVDTEDHTFYLNPHSREVLGENHLAHVFAAGRLLGRALLDGNVTGFHLSMPLLKIILGLPVDFADLEFFDPEAHRSLSWLLATANVDAICLDFTVTYRLPDGSFGVKELIPGGSTIGVTDENKQNYVDRKLQYLVFESVSKQLFAFLKGFYEIMPPEKLVLFDAEELDYVLSGSDDVDVDDWETHTVVSASLLGHPALKNFWRLVRELNLAERRALLQFATGTTRLPPTGFAALTSHDGRHCPFTLHGIALWRSKGCFRSHSCFNRLDVPLYLNLDELRRALKVLIDENDIGFTID